MTTQINTLIMRPFFLSHKLYVLIFFNFLLNLHYHAQEKHINISQHGIVTVETNLTSYLNLPFSEAIIKLTDNSLSLKRIQQDSISILSSTPKSPTTKYPLWAFSFDEKILKKLGLSTKHREFISRMTPNEYVYSYTLIHQFGCWTNGMHTEEEYFMYRVSFKKNKLHSIEMKTKRKQKQQKIFGSFSYYRRSGKLKKINISSSGKSYSFNYNRKGYITNISEHRNDIKSQSGLDSVRVVYFNYILGQRHFIFCEKDNHFMYKRLASKKDIKNILAIYDKMKSLDEKIELAYTDPNASETKLELMEEEFDSLESKYDNLVESIDPQPQFYIHQFENGNLASIGIMDIEYPEEFEVADSFSYNSSNQLIKYASYQRDKEIEIYKYNYSSKGKLFQMTYIIPHNTGSTSYTYDYLGRIDTIIKNSYDDILNIKSIQQYRLNYK